MRPDEDKPLCPHCSGTGERYDRPCDVCRGSGLARVTDDERCSPDDLDVDDGD